MSRHRTVTGQLELPKNWKWVPLGEILTNIIGGGTPSKNNPSYWQGNIPWLTIKDMRTRRPIDSIDHISETAVEESSTNIIPADTVIIATRVGLGKVIRVPYDATINQDLKALIPKDGIDKSYLEYWIVSIADYLESIGSGTTVKGIRLETLREIPFPLAPPEDQKLIVAQIDKQFSRLDEAVTALKRIQANLKRYKASVLKTAVEGKLTEQWRKEHPDIEPADHLLKRILAERRAKWEAEELAKLKVKGLKPRDDSWKKKYKEPAGPDMANLPELPEGWVWATPFQLDSGEAYATAIGPFGSNLKVSDYCSEGVPLVFVRNIRSNMFSGVETKYVSGDKSHELRPHWVKPGDVLITKMGDPPGDATSYPEGFPIAVLTADCIKMTLSPMLEKHRSFVIHAINSEVIKRQIADITQGVAQQKISLGRFAQIGIPLPPLKEQVVILEELDRRLSVTEELEAIIETNLKRTERMRQTILQQAFAGGVA